MSQRPHSGDLTPSVLTLLLVWHLLTPSSEEDCGIPSSGSSLIFWGRLCKDRHSRGGSGGIKVLYPQNLAPDHPPVPLLPGASGITSRAARPRLSLCVGERGIMKVSGCGLVTGNSLTPNSHDLCFARAVAGFPVTVPQIHTHKKRSWERRSHHPNSDPTWTAFLRLEPSNLGQGH